MKSLQNKGNTAKWHKPRIMLADDEPIITLAFNDEQKIMALQLIPSIISTIPSSSFKDGFYTRVFLDLRMSKMNGFELGNEIRKLDYAVKVSFINAFDIQERSFKLAIPTLNEENPLFIIKPLIHINDNLVPRIKEKLKQIINKKNKPKVKILVGYAAVTLHIVVKSKFKTLVPRMRLR